MLDDKDEFEREGCLVYLPPPIASKQDMPEIFMSDRPYHWINLGGRAATVEDVLKASFGDLVRVDRHD